MLRNNPVPARRWLVWALAGLCLCVLSACAVLGIKEVGRDFTGVREIMQTSRITQLLMVHGMGDHDVGYSGVLRAGLIRELDLVLYADRGVRTLCVSSEPSCVTHAFLKSWDYQQVKTGKLLRFYELTWAPVTRPVKSVALSEDLDISIHRVTLNDALKVFINDSLSDPILYVGKYGQQIQDVVQQALCIVKQDAGAAEFLQESVCTFGEATKTVEHSDSSVILVSHSLGSKIIYDALLALHSRESRVERSVAFGEVKAFVSRMRAVYMLANQIPFLELAAVGRVADAGRGNNSLQRLIDLRQSPYPLQVVAFTDPNDLLSYPLAEKYCSGRPGSDASVCTNVYVTNVEPSLFGQFSNPLTAHSGYFSNPFVVRLVACGGRKGQRSKCPRRLNTSLESVEDIED